MNKNLKIANQKYYNYLIDCIVDKTMISMRTSTNGDSEKDAIWFCFKFDDENNNTNYKCGSCDECNLFNVLNATRRITNFLIEKSITPKEITIVLDLLKLRWSEKLGIKFIDNNYGLPYEYTKYKWGG